MVALTMASSGEVLAMTPGSSLSYWRPEQVPGLSVGEVEYLQQTHCMIESYRDDSVAPRKSAAPDENDIMLLARGELAAKGQNDLAVYCKAKNSGEEFFLVKWAGSKQCPGKFLLSEQSMFFKQHGPQHDYYGDVLRVLPAKEVLGDIDDLYNAGYMETPPQQWRMNAKDVPPIEHDALAYAGYYDLYLYCDQGKWLKLLDRYSDEID